MKATRLLPLLLAGLLGCGSTGTPEEAKPILVYPIAANTADTIVFDAMRREFDAGSIQRVTAPHMGYKATAVATTDTIALYAYRIQAKGQRRNGSTSPGFHFEVKDTGGSEAGAKAVERIRTWILAAASREAGGLPVAVETPASTN